MKGFNCVVCRYGELGLKGDNRIFFEKQLIQNMKYEIRKRKIDACIFRKRGRILIYTSKRVDFLKNIFGLVSFSYALELEAEMDKIKKAVDDFVFIKKGQTFRVTAKRVEKITAFDSMEVHRQIGAHIVQSRKAKVDLSDYDVEVYLEFFNDKAYLFIEKRKCFGGLPSGVEGNVFIEIKTERDVVAALMMMRRGCRVFYKLKSKIFAKLLSEFENGRNLIKARSDTEIDYLSKVSSSEFSDVGVDKEFILRPLVFYDNSDVKKQLKAFVG